MGRALLAPTDSELWTVAHRLSDGQNTQAVAQHIWLPELMQSCGPLRGMSSEPRTVRYPAASMIRSAMEYTSTCISASRWEISCSERPAASKETAIAYSYVLQRRSSSMPRFVL